MQMSAVNALLVDLLAGEPPNVAHPTVWMGKWLSGGRSRRVSGGSVSSLAEGTLLLGAGIAITTVTAMAVTRLVGRQSMRTQRALAGLALKPALSVRALIAAAERVQSALEGHDIVRARSLLGRDLVSRDTSALTRHEIAGATIESVAENLSDSVVAPLLAFRAGGLVGAYVYRFINTADAMLGYRTTELEWYGKSAACADDVVNFIPARVTAGLICTVARAAHGSPSLAVSTMLRDASNTDSPNAGWPMAAMAGALNVRLTKQRQYELNALGYEPVPYDIARSCRIALAVSAIAATLVDLS